MYWSAVILILPYFVLILIIQLKLRRITAFKSGSGSSVSVSLIIPCKNEELRLPSLLRSLNLQNYPPDLLEIIIVDDHSSDKTYEIASSFDFPGRVVQLRNKGDGKKSAISTGADAATGSLLITTDADCTMGRNWIRTLASYFDVFRPDMIIGPVILSSAGGFFGKFQELEFMGLQGITAGTASGGNGVMCNGANLAFTREVYFECRSLLKFAHPSGDDIFLLHSLKKVKSSKILWIESEEAVVTAGASHGLKQYLNQRSRWISKWKLYNDSHTIALAVVTFLAVILQLFLTIAACFDLHFLLPFLSVVMLKSIPDYMILFNRTFRYRKQYLMRWFIPAQLIYPFYVIGVVLFPSTAKCRN